MDIFTGIFGGTSVIFILLGFLVTILWVILPFAIFGIKPRLNSITKELALLREVNNSIGKDIQQTNKLLKDIADTIRDKS